MCSELNENARRPIILSQPICSLYRFHRWRASFYFNSWPLSAAFVNVYSFRNTHPSHRFVRKPLSPRGNIFASQLSFNYNLISPGPPCNVHKKNDCILATVAWLSTNERSNSSGREQTPFQSATVPGRGFWKFAGRIEWFCNAGRETGGWCRDNAGGWVIFGWMRPGTRYRESAVAWLYIRIYGEQECHANIKLN